MFANADVSQLVSKSCLGAGVIIMLFFLKVIDALCFLPKVTQHPQFEEHVWLIVLATDINSHEPLQLQGFMRMYVSCIGRDWIFDCAICFISEIFNYFFKSKKEYTNSHTLLTFYLYNTFTNLVCNCSGNNDSALPDTSL